MLDPDHKRMLAYFWLEKGDPTRYTAWDALKDTLPAEWPEFWHAWTMHLFYSSALNSICRAADSSDDIGERSS